MNDHTLALYYAHQLQKNAAQQMLLASKQKPVNWAQRLKFGWYLVRFRKWLKDGIVTFSYWKKDGSIRQAKGTLNDLLIPADKLPKGDMSDGAAIYQHNYAAVPYFDLDKQEWRSFTVTHFIGFVSKYLVFED